MEREFQPRSNNYFPMQVINLTKKNAPAGLARKIWKEFFQEEKIGGDYNVNLAFAGEKRIRELNGKYRGRNEVTDVLSFGNFKKGETVEIVICLPRAGKQAARLGHSLEKEIGRLFLHGLAHAVGLNHEKGGEEEKVMRAKEMKVLKRMGLEIVY